jgi:hypothetical protein
MYPTINISYFNKIFYYVSKLKTNKKIKTVFRLIIDDE